MGEGTAKASMGAGAPGKSKSEFVRVAREEKRRARERSVATVEGSMRVARGEEQSPPVALPPLPLPLLLPLVDPPTPLCDRPPLPTPHSTERERARGGGVVVVEGSARGCMKI